MQRCNTSTTFWLLGFAVLVITSATTNAALYSFGLDRFQINRDLLADSIDEFDDNHLGSWYVDNGTAIEAGGLLTLTNPGDISTEIVDGYLATYEESEVASIDPSYGVADGEGGFTATTTLVTGAPAQNSLFFMEFDIESSVDNLDDIVIGISNLDPMTAGVTDGRRPSGLSIMFLNDEPGFAALQSVPIVEADITGDILLSLTFDDSTNQVTGAYSLDGGSSFLSPFSPIDTRIDQASDSNWELTAMSLDAEAVPEPSSVLLLGTGLAVLARLNRRRRA
jgi:hypothetical protein